MRASESAATGFEPCEDDAMGGLLAGLPALCENGLLSGLDRYLSLPSGFYSAMHILFLLGFMALARIRRPEGLRPLPPGELGKVVGLDRVPDVRTLRKKIALMAKILTDTVKMIAYRSETALVGLTGTFFVSYDEPTGNVVVGAANTAGARFPQAPPIQPNR